MNQLMLMSMEELAIVSGRRFILPSESDPVWLRHAAANEQALAEILAERRAQRRLARNVMRPARIVARLRLVLARG